MNKKRLKNKTSDVLTVNNVIVFAVIGLIALFIVKSDKYVETTRQGVAIWATTVLPSLLPFFFLTAILTKTANLSKISKKLNPVSKFLYGADGISLYVRLMSLLSGYPVGAKIICDLYKSGIITEQQAEKYCTFTSTSGPLFIVGAVGVGMYDSKIIGMIILLSHVASSLLTGVIFRKLPDNRPIGTLSIKTDCDNALYESVYSAVISVLTTGGLIAVFFTFSQIVADLYILYPLEKFLSLFLGENYSKALTSGIIECTKGALSLSRSGGDKLSVSLCSALVSFGGISVWCQSFCYLGKCKVRIFIFALSKLLHSIFAFLLCYLLLSISAIS